MTKRLFLFAAIFIFTSILFGALFPYPVFCRYTNLNLNDISYINESQERERIINRDENIHIKNYPWEIVNYIFPLDTDLEIFDLNSNQSFTIKRIGGKNHADVILTKEEEKESLKQTYKDEKRCVPILLKLTNNLFLPASFDTYPHGQENHYCMYFSSSKTEKNNYINKNHSKSLKYAQKNASKYVEKI